MFDRIRRAIRSTNQPPSQPTASVTEPARLPTLSASVGFIANPDLRLTIREVEEECGHILSLRALVQDGIVAVDQYGSHFILTSQGVN